MIWFIFVVFKQKTAYEWHISDWRSDVGSSDLIGFTFRKKMHHYATGKSECERRNNVANIFHQLVLNNERLRLGLKQGLNKPIRACSVHPEIGRASCREVVCQYV